MTILRNARNPIHRLLTNRWLGRLVGLAIVLAALGIGTLLALRTLRTPPPATLLRGQQLVTEIVNAIQSDPAVAVVSGAYVPDNALILYTQLTSGETDQTRTWAEHQIEPFLARLHELPEHETLTWIIEQTTPAENRSTGGTEAQLQQEVLTVKFGLITDPLHYQYIRNILGNLTNSTTSNTLTPADLTATTTTAAEQTDRVETTAATVPATGEDGLSSTELSTKDGQSVVQPETSSAGTATDGNEASLPALDSPNVLRAISFTPTDVDPNAPSEWRSISGTWDMQEGIYRQLDPEGYDYITMLNLSPQHLSSQQHYIIEVQLRMNRGEMGGGIVYNAPNQANRAGAQIIDMDERGRYLRWGYYNTDGLYTFVGGATLDVGLTDGAWHRLRVVAQEETSSIWFDDQEVGRTTNQRTAGYLGLVTSRAQVDFDDLVVTALPLTPLTLTVDTIETGVIETEPSTSGNMVMITPKVTETAAITSQTVISAATNLTSALYMTETALFWDDFAAGNRNGWQVLNGTWQFLSESYQQTAIDGSDLATVSPFQGSSYRATVRMRLLAGNMGAGLIFNMAQRNAKKQSQLIRFNNNGRDLQWGAFDEGGNFILQGSTMIPNGGDGAWHTLTVDIAEGRATFSVDNITVAQNIALIYDAGYLGLFTTKSQVAFDDLVVIPPLQTTQSQNN